MRPSARCASPPSRPLWFCPARAQPARAATPLAARRGHRVEPEVALPALAAGEFDLVLGEEYPGQPLPRPRETERHDLLTDELRLIIPAGWSERSLTSLASRPLCAGTRRHHRPGMGDSGSWKGGFEPDARYTSTDLQIHLRLAESGLAAALLPDLSGAGDRRDVETHRLQGRPRRQIFTTVRSGAARHPKVQAFTTALKAHGPSQTPGTGLKEHVPGARGVDALGGAVSEPAWRAMSQRAMSERAGVDRHRDRLPWTCSGIQGKVGGWTGSARAAIRRPPGHDLIGREAEIEQLRLLTSRIGQGQGTRFCCRATPAWGRRPCWTMPPPSPPTRGSGGCGRPARSSRPISPMPRSISFSARAWVRSRT